MVGKFEDAFWAWEVCDFVVHQTGVGFYWCEPDVIGFLGWVSKRKVWRIGPKGPKGSIAMVIRITLRSRR